MQKLHVESSKYIIVILFLVIPHIIFVIAANLCLNNVYTHPTHDIINWSRLRFIIPSTI